MLKGETLTSYLAKADKLWSEKIRLGATMEEKDFLSVVINGLSSMW